MDIETLVGWENDPITKYISNELVRMTFIRRCGCELQWANEKKERTEYAEQAEYVVLVGHQGFAETSDMKRKYLVGKKHIQVEKFLTMPHDEWCKIFNNFFGLLYDQRRAIPISEYQFYDEKTYLILDDYIYHGKDQLFLIDTVAHCLRRNPMQEQMEYTKQT